MRFVLSTMIWVVIVGGLWLYIAYRDSGVEQIRPVEAKDLSVAEVFSLELTPTFSAVEDPFALQTADTPAAALEVRLNGQRISLPEQEITRGRTVVVDQLSGVLQGHNEIYLKASPPFGESQLDNGVRVRLYDQDTLLTDETIWGSGGSLVSGTVTFIYGTGEDTDHEH